MKTPVRPARKNARCSYLNRYGPAHGCARSLPDARDIVGELTAAEVKLNIGGSLHDSNDPVARLLLNVLAVIAEFEPHLIKMPTREGMKIAQANGRLRRRALKFAPPRRPTSWGNTEPGNTPRPS